MYSHKRKFAVLLILVFISFCLFLGCKSADAEDKNLNGSFAIRFFSLGDGECTAIRFPDGKNAVIDCGGADKSDKITSSLEEFLSGKIDYLVLSSIEEENIGAIIPVIDKFEIGTAFVPYKNGIEEFPVYSEVLEKLKAKCKVQNAELSSFAIGEDYFMGFLSPESLAAEKVLGSGADSVSNKDISNLSPITYLKYKNFQAIFLGDSSAESQNEVYNKFFTGIYDYYYRAAAIDLTAVNLIKLSNHGSYSHFSEKFFTQFRPDYSVISVSGVNPNSYPSTATLKALYKIDPETEILRTDVLGDITVYVDKESNVKIVTESKFI